MGVRRASEPKCAADARSRRGEKWDDLSVGVSVRRSGGTGGDGTEPCCRSGPDDRGRYGRCGQTGISAEAFAFLRCFSFRASAREVSVRKTAYSNAVFLCPVFSSKRKNGCDGTPGADRMRHLVPVRGGSPKIGSEFPIRPAFSYFYPNLILSTAWNSMY